MLKNVVSFLQSRLTQQGTDLKKALENESASNASLRDQLSSTMRSLGELQASVTAKEVGLGLGLELRSPITIRT